MTQGERKALTSALIACALGAFLGILMALKLAGATGFSEVVSLGRLWMIGSSAAGAAIGLYLLRNLFGRPGFNGYVWATLGGIALIFVGGVVGGTMTLPVFGTMFGPLLLVSTIADTPSVVFVMWATVLAIHVQYRDYVVERDSISDVD